MNTVSNAIGDIEEFNKDFLQAIKTYTALHAEYETCELECRFYRGQQIQRSIDLGMKITESERLMDANKDMFDQKKAAILVKQQEMNAELYLRLLEHRGRFLSAMLAMQRVELEKTR